VDRPPRDEDERSRHRTDPALTDQEEEFSLEDVEQFVRAMVNMAGGPYPGRLVASRNPIEPPVCSLVAFSVMASVPGTVRPSPGPRMMPSEAAPPFPCPADSLTFCLLSPKLR
jgi:hypothetical protein